MTGPVVVTPGAFTLDDLAALYHDRRHIALADGWQPLAQRTSAIVDAAAHGTAAVYGVNTGFGALARKRIPPAETERLQRNLVLSHCCGVGRPTPEAIVRLMMALKAASLARGASGVRPAVIEMLLAMLAAGVTPVVPEQGSVGASGDLAPLAHMSAVMIGEGTAEHAGARLPGAVALARAGLAPIVLGPKEGLALINGTQFSAAFALAGLLECHRALQSALVTGALSVDAAMASTTPFRPEIQALRGQPGQVRVAAALCRLLDGSGIRALHVDGDERVQDPYCLRCQPQVMGACLDLLAQAAATLLVEANAVTDNPLVLAETGEIVSGGNFHAEPVAFAADQIALAASEIGALAERRIATLVDPALSFGLPAFLSPTPGLNSGLMIAEVTAAALYAENKQRAAPCSLYSTPTSANIEDHVSMSANAARRLLPMAENRALLLGIELVAAAQGIGLRKAGFGLERLAGARTTGTALASSAPLERVIARLRAEVAFLEDDRFLADDLEAAGRLVATGEVVASAGAALLPGLSETIDRPQERP